MDRQTGWIYMKVFKQMHMHVCNFTKGSLLGASCVKWRGNLPLSVSRHLSSLL